MGLPPLTFTGVSKFSSDFQTILDRGRQISEVPVRQLQNKDSDIIKRKTLLTSLSSSISALATSLSNLGTTAANKALTARSSNSDKVTVINSGATHATSYTIDSITSPATIASERSLTAYADSNATPVSATGSLKLIVAGEEFDFSLSNNTLVGLRDKINALGAGVTASILTTSDGNYLSITANGTGEKPIQLRDDPSGANTSLLTATNPGTNAEFELNGIPLTQSGNVVNSIIPGVTFTIEAASATPVTLSLETDRTKLSDALQDFVTKYNAARSELNGQIGPAAGLLAGNTLVAQLSNGLREIASYRTFDGDIRGLADLGIEFNSSGEASFNSDVFDTLSSNDIADGFTFLGSATTGIGALASNLRQLADPVSGLIRVEQEGLDRQDKSLQNQIATLNERITIQQNALAAKLHAADALLARLSSQQNQIDASLQGLNLTLYGKNSG